MLKDSLLIDPTFAEFNQLMGFLAKATDSLFDIHDGEPLNSDISAYTKDYMDEQMVHIVYNFSNERLDLLKKICKHLYSDRARKIETKRTSQQKIRHHNMSNKQLGKKLTVAGITTVVVGVAVDAAVPIIVLGVVATVVGSTMIIKNR